MFDAAHKADNGVTVEYVDMGVEYGYNGRTLQFLGEQHDGELSTGGEVIGYYERDDDADMTVVTLNDGREFELSSEYDYEALAKQLLSE